MADKAVDLLFYFLMVAIVFVLVRPGSKAGTAVKGISTVLIALVGETTGWTGAGHDSASG